MMDDYKLMLQQLSDSDSSSIISNSSTEHAIPLIAKLFQRAQNEVLIFTGSLNPDIYAVEDVVDSASSFVVGRSGAMRVIVQKDHEEVPDKEIYGAPETLIGKLRERFGASALDKIELYRAGPGVRGLDFHFMVVDGAAFRFEPDNTKHEAFASFNNVETGSKLRITFEKLASEKMSHKIQIH